MVAAIGVLVAPAGSVAGGASRTGAAAPAQAGDGGRTYRPPVVAPVADPFRPPPEPWLPGNRGIEYATAPGTPARAIGPGTVTFAGPVAGSLHVTVAHPDGLRSSYSFLAAVRTTVGHRVGGGEVLGVAGDRLHLGVRRGDVYLDPASLWGTPIRGGRVVLVPLDGGTPAVAGSGGSAPTDGAVDDAIHPSPSPPAPTGPLPGGAGSRLGPVAVQALASLSPGLTGPAEGPGP